MVNLRMSCTGARLLLLWAKEAVRFLPQHLSVESCTDQLSPDDGLPRFPRYYVVTWLCFFVWSA